MWYANGRGVPEDDAKAVYWYRKAAEQGIAKAQSNLGLMYDNGEGVSEDDAKAVYWYRKSAERGHAKAQYNLGLMYDNGYGVSEDDAKAVGDQSPDFSLISFESNRLQATEHIE